MGDTIDLSGREAIEKIKAIAADQAALFCTFTGPTSVASRPMATQRIDDDGTIWFMSAKDSPKIEQITKTPRVQLFYMVSASSAYLSVVGPAFLSQDRAKIHELWTPFAKAWFEKGPDDPNIMLVGVRPTEGHYWDSKHGRMLQLVAIAIGAATGKPIDDGREGALRPT